MSVILSTEGGVSQYAPGQGVCVYHSMHLGRDVGYRGGGQGGLYIPPPPKMATAAVSTGMHICYCARSKVSKGYIFTGVCHSVHWMGGGGGGDKG